MLELAEAERPCGSDAAKRRLVDGATEVVELVNDQSE